MDGGPNNAGCDGAAEEEDYCGGGVSIFCLRFVDFQNTVNLLINSNADLKAIMRCIVRL